MFIVWAFLYVVCWDIYGVTVVVEHVLRHWMPREIGTERIVNPQIIDLNSQLPSTYG